MAVLRSPLRPVLRSPLYDPLVGKWGGGPAFSPLDLFSNGEAGGFWDPSNLSTLFQDAAGTTPVTQGGDPVGRMEDLSGNGNHLTQTTDTARPTYRTDGTFHWLESDGVDDVLNVDALPVSDTSYLAAAFSTEGDAAGGGSAYGANTPFWRRNILVGLSASLNPIVALDLRLGDGATSITLPSVIQNHTAFIADTLCTPSTIDLFSRDAAGNEASDSELHGLTPSSNTNPGSLFGVPTPIRFFGGVHLGRVTTDTERASMRQWLAAKAGVTL